MPPVTVRSSPVARRTSLVMVQKRKSIVKALAKAESMFTIIATLEVSPPAKREKNLPSKRKKGAPGGWPTSSLKEQRMNSPQSQKLTVGSIVRR